MHEGLGERSAESVDDAVRLTRRGSSRIPLAFEKVEVPVIAAVNGAAIGAGNDLTLHVRYPYRRREREVRGEFRQGRDHSGRWRAWLLPRVVGYSKACEMAFTGDILNAQEALACRLVSKVVPDAELMPTARAMAARIAALRRKRCG
jgi:enoyl-CoA hydratase/carnithine racemase